MAAFSVTVDIVARCRMRQSAKQGAGDSEALGKLYETGNLLWYLGLRVDKWFNKGIYEFFKQRKGSMCGVFWWIKIGSVKITKLSNKHSAVFSCVALAWLDDHWHHDQNVRGGAAASGLGSWQCLACGDATTNLKKR